MPTHHPARYHLQVRDPFTGRTMVVAREPGGQPQSASDQVPVLAEVAAIALAREDAERRLYGRSLPPTG